MSGVVNVGRHKIDFEILRFLEKVRRASLGEIAAALGQKKPYVRERLRVLIDEGFVKQPYRGIYELNQEE